MRVYNLGTQNDAAYTSLCPAAPESSQPKQAPMGTKLSPERLSPCTHTQTVQFLGLAQS